MSGQGAATTDPWFSFQMPKIIPGEYSVPSDRFVSKNKTMPSLTSQEVEQVAKEIRNESRAAFVKAKVQVTFSEAELAILVRTTVSFRALRRESPLRSHSHTAEVPVRDALGGMRPRILWMTVSGSIPLLAGMIAMERMEEQLELFSQQCQAHAQDRQAAGARRPKESVPSPG